MCLLPPQIITGSLGSSPKGVPPVDELITFVQGRADALSGQLIPHQSKPEHKSEHQVDHQQDSSAFNPIIFRYQPQCTLCMDERHSLYVCPSFKVERQANRVRNQNLCYNCLGSRNRTRVCKSLSRCKLHSTTLHLDQASSSVPGGEQPSAEEVTANVSASTKLRLFPIAS